MDAPRIERFAGRERELKELESAIDEGKVVVVVGIAGIGKTTLASKLCSLLKNRKNLFWYKLTRWDTPANVLSRIGDFFAEMGKDGLRGYLRSTEPLDMNRVRRILVEEGKESNAVLFFDDLQKADEDVVNLFSLLLDVIEKTRGFSIVILTREFRPFYDRRDVLIRGLVDEMELGGLDEASSSQLLSEVVKKKEELQQLYQYTNGHPLFLEMIRSRISGDVSEIESLSQIERFIEEEVYSGLDELERTMMKIASLYEVPVDRDALFLDGRLKYETLSKLKRKSMIQSLGDGRVEAHEILRSHFVSILTPHEKNAFSKGALAELERMAEVARADHRKTDSIHLLTNGLEISIDEEDRTRLLEKLGDLYVQTGQYEKALLDYQEAISLLPNPGDRARVQRKRGDAYFEWGKPDEALTSYEKALESVGDRNSPEGGRIALGVSQVLFQRDEYEDALGEAERALEIFEGEKGDQLDLAKAHNLIGLIEMQREPPDLERSENHLIKALSMMEELGDERGMAESCNNLGLLYLYTGELEKGVDHLYRCLQISEDIGDSFLQLRALFRLAWAESDILGHAETAQKYASRALRLAKRTGNLWGLSGSHCYLGRALYLGDRYDEALEELENSIEVAKEAGMENLVLIASFEKVGVLRAMGESEEAIDLGSEILQKAEESGNKELEADVLRLLGMAYRDKREFPTAMDRLEKARTIYKELKSEKGEATVLLEEALLHMQSEDLERARAMAKASLEIFEKFNWARKLSQARKLLEELAS